MPSKSIQPTLVPNAADGCRWPPKALARKGRHSMTKQGEIDCMRLAIREASRARPTEEDINIVEEPTG